MRCFVACAFGHTDVDAIYENIKNVLSAMGVTAQRVDRINHNKKIDSKIIELIEKCDLCIADLTYARPSVYYEAGRVHGRKRPVVFTCRRDHFEGKTENSKIHFDLVTENIIGWDSPSKKFETDLRRRLTPILAPLLEDKKAHEKVKAEEISYEQLSLEEKQYFVETNIRDFLKKNGFTLERRSYESGYRKDTAVLSIVLPRMSSKALASLRQFFVYISLDELKQVVNFKKATILICPIASISKATIHHALPAYSQRNPELKAFSKVTSDGDITYAFLDNVKSITDLKKRLSEFFL